MAIELSARNICIAIAIIIVIILIMRYFRDTQPKDTLVSAPVDTIKHSEVQETEIVPRDGFYLTSLDNPQVRFPAKGYIRVTFGPKRDTYMLYPYATTNPSENPRPWILADRGAIMATLTNGCFLLTLINERGSKWIVYGAQDGKIRTCELECCDALADSRWLIHKC